MTRVGALLPRIVFKPFSAAPVLASSSCLSTMQMQHKVCCKVGLCTVFVVLGSSRAVQCCRIHALRSSVPSAGASRGCLLHHDGVQLCLQRAPGCSGGSEHRGFARCSQHSPAAMLLLRPCWFVLGPQRPFGSQSALIGHVGVRV